MTRRAVFPAVSPKATAVAALIGGALLLPAVVPQAAAQGRPVLTNAVPESEAVTIHAKITALDPATRKVTLTGRSGAPVTVTAGPNIRLEMLKVGDIVDAQYYRSVAFVVSQPGATAPEDEIQQALARPIDAPGGIGMKVTRVSGLVVGIDLSAHSVDLVNPEGGQVFTIKVTNPERQAKLPMLKVGDTITAVISEALAVSVQPAKKGLFG
ncbi:hypothetical protein [Azospirillum rugosum]|uniref:DUF5666 domain-containing protein n=1 Tax=Azospirillum rugosum TaxID=416170 RepID=A0ABS4SW41_9PROT|nr:hypothetical protein [Azospirillum rugosum]MBP2296781.1 hypothetical protein [Azospirillum rugosum]MDQ0530384.1 hypothetical protein [Azospirillum rugosum]